VYREKRSGRHTVISQLVTQSSRHTVNSSPVNSSHSVSLKHDGTDGTATTDETGATGHKSYRFAAKISLRALTQTSHEVVHTCKRTTCVTTAKFPLVSHLASTTAVPSVLVVPSPTGQTGRRPYPVCLAVPSVPSVPSCFRLTCHIRVSSRSKLVKESTQQSHQLPER